MSFLPPPRSSLSPSLPPFRSFLSSFLYQICCPSTIYLRDSSLQLRSDTSMNFKYPYTDDSVSGISILFHWPTDFSLTTTSYFSHYNFIISLDICKNQTLFISKSLFTISGLFYFYINSTMTLSNSDLDCDCTKSIDISIRQELTFLFC